MAEAVLRAEAGDLAEVASAGSHPLGYVHPLAIKVLEEAGYDVAGARSKSWDEFLGREVDVVITVCGNADAACPSFPGKAVRRHWPFDDPGNFQGSEEEVLAAFRRVRDDIRRLFSAYAAGLRDGARGEAGR